MKAHILCGLDRPELYHSSLSGRRVGLMTNQTGIDHLYRPSIDIIHKNYRLNLLMAVEHGVRGDIQAGEQVDSMVDKKTGVPVFSLYGDAREPSEALMKELDVAVYDMQDVGARFYTYLYSLSYLMQACAKYNVPLVIMDRLNPLGGLRVEGTILEEKVHSFVGEHPIPTRYALTVGEYALYVRRLLKLDIDLTVIPLDGWRRNMYLDNTDTPWVSPSPNCATLHAAECFVGTCIFEGTNLSEGRGTSLPFEFVGAPWVDADQLAENMRKRALPGVFSVRALLFRRSPSIRDNCATVYNCTLPTARKPAHSQRGCTFWRAYANYSRRTSNSCRPMKATSHTLTAYWARLNTLRAMSMRRDSSKSMSLGWKNTRTGSKALNFTNNQSLTDLPAGACLLHAHSVSGCFQFFFVELPAVEYAMPVDPHFLNAKGFAPVRRSIEQFLGAEHGKISKALRTNISSVL